MAGSIFPFFEMAGTIAFAVSGAMTALKKDMDIFGVAILALCTAIGGGVIRDIVLGITPPGAFENPLSTGVAICTAVMVFLPFVRRQFTRVHRLYDVVLFFMDTAGLSIFTVIGVETAYLTHSDPGLFLLIFVGVITGVGGGVLRDIMAGNTPYIFVKHFYATASLAGALLCAVLWPVMGKSGAMLCGAFTVTVLRVCAAHFRWSLPRGRQDVTPQEKSSETDAE